MSDGASTPDGDRQWAVIRRVYNAVARALKVVAHGFDGTSYPAVSTDSDGHLQVDILSGGASGGTEFDDGDSITTDSQGTLLIGTDGIPGIARALRCSAGGTLLVDGSAVTQPVSGTVTANAGTGTFVVGDGGGSLTVDGTVTANAGSGTFVVGDGGGSLTVDGTVSVTEPVSVDDNGGSLTVDATNLDIRDLTSTDVVTVTGGAGQTADVKVTLDGEAVTLNEPVSVDDNGGSLTVDGTVAVSSVAGTVTVDTELTTKDYDTGAGTDTVAAVGILLPASGGSVAGGTSTNPVRVDPTGTTTQPVSDAGGSLTVDGTVTANAGSGTFVVGDGGGSLTVDGTVSVSGTVTVDSELPAAAALADNTSNPTVPGVGAFVMVFDGSTWDRLPGNSAGGVVVQGPTQVDQPVAQLPVQVAVEADDSIKGAVSADGEVVRPWADRRGRLVVATQFPGDIKYEENDLANTTETEVTDDPASTHRIVLTNLSAHNSSSTAVTITFRDGVTGTIVKKAHLAANGGGFETCYSEGLPLTANNPLTAQLGASVSTVFVNTVYKTVTV
jgi:hypothetical protein